MGLDPQPLALCASSQWIRSYNDDIVGVFMLACLRTMELRLEVPKPKP